MSFRFRLILFALAYWAGAELSYLLLLKTDNLVAFWPPAGLYLAMLLATPKRRWWAVMLAASVPNLLSDAVIHHQTLPVSLSLLLINLGASLVCAALVVRLCRPSFSFAHLPHVLRWSAIVSLISTPLSALSGATLFMIANGEDFGLKMLFWWLGDLLGVLLVTPLAYGVLTERPWLRRAQVVEAAALLLSLGAATAWVFRAPGNLALPSAVLFFFLLWAALRFSVTIVAAAATVLAVIAIWLTEAGFGPYSFQATPPARLLMAQLLVITGALLFCIFTAAIAELRTAERTLRNVNVDLEQQVQARTAKLTATNEQLLDSEERLRVATDAAEMYAWEVDVNTRIIKYADNHARVLGFALPADFAAMQEIIHPDDRGESLATFENALTTGKDFEAESRLVNPSTGAIVWICTNGVIMQDGAGKPSRILGLVQNITRRKEAEEKLRVSETRYRSLFELAAVGIAQTDGVSGRFQEVNDEYCRITGYSREELLGLNFPDLTYEADRAADRKIRGQLARGEHPQATYVKRYVRKDGQIIWVQINATIVRDQAGKVVSGISIVQDITERKQAEAEIKQLSDYNRNVLESITDPFFTLDREYRFTYMSSQGEKLVFHAPGELLGKSLWEEFPGVLDTPFEKMYRGVVEDNITSTVEGFYPDHDRWYEVTAYPSPNGTTVYFKDISERKRSELNLAFLSDINLDLTRPASADEIMRTASAEIGAYFDVSTCGFCEVDMTANTSLVHPLWLRDKTAVDFAGLYNLSEYVSDEFRKTLTAGQPVIVNDIAADPRTAANADKFAPLKILSFINTPFADAGDLKFVLGVWNDAPREWQTDEIELLRELVTRVWTRIERAHAEENLRESEERFRTLFDSIDEGFCVIEMIFDEANKPLDYRFVQANPALERLTGLKDAIGKTIREMVPDLEEYWFEFYGNVALTGEAARVENEAATMNRWFEIYASRVGDESSRRVAVVFNNITERKQSEVKLHASEVRYRRLFETAKDGILILNSETARITNANSYISELLGFSQAELLGKELWEIGLFKDMDESKAAVRELQENKYIRYEDLPLKTKAGHRADVEFVSNVYQENGHSVIQCNIRDITERKHAEAERERLLVEAQRSREDAETATRAKDEFLAVVSHELRNPLHSILGYARLLRTMPPEAIDASQIKKTVDIIERNGKAQLELINDLLDTARIISGKLKLEIVPLDLSIVINDAVEVMRPAAEAKNISLLHKSDPGVGQIVGDPQRLQQIIWNLINNAVKFTQSGGLVNVTLHRAGADLIIQIRDNGKGISPDFLSQIFGRFTQADASATRRHGGLGLGLSLVKQLVELHGGEISAESEGEGKGTTFTIKLPVQSTYNYVEEARRSLTLSEPDRQMFAGLSVLVIDDDHEARELMTTLLYGYGADVTTVASASGGFALLTDETNGKQFSVLISDIGMPEEDGYSLMRRFREWERDRGQRLPAIAITAFGRTEDRMAAMVAGFQMHVSKPVETEELIAVINSLLGRFNQTQ